MTDRDEREFKTLMLTMQSVFRQPMDKVALAQYWRVLYHWPIEGISFAVDRLIETQTSSYLPMPAHIDQVVRDTQDLWWRPDPSVKLIPRVTTDRRTPEERRADFDRTAEMIRKAREQLVARIKGRTDAALGKSA